MSIHCPIGNKAKLIASSALLLIWCGPKAQAETTLTSVMPEQGDTIEVFYHWTDPTEKPENGKDKAAAEPPPAQSTPIIQLPGSSKPPPPKPKPPTARPDLKFKDVTYKLFPDSDIGPRTPSWHTLLAIPADLHPGLYQLRIAGEDTVIRVKDAGFHVQSIGLPKAKDNFNMSPGEEEAVNKAKATLTDNRYWKGRFVAPSTARRSATFGLRRQVNGHLLKDYFHTGLDFATPLGSPIVATQAGKVVLAHEGYKLHGNVVAIDHGQGVVSFYLHLQKINVAVGDLVKAGQTIGLAGQTGRANGPHLHFSIYVNGVASNPELWLSRIF